VWKAFLISTEVNSALCAGSGALGPLCIVRLGMDIIRNMRVELVALNLCYNGGEVNFTWNDFETYPHDAYNLGIYL